MLRSIRFYRTENINPVNIYIYDHPLHLQPESSYEIISVSKSLAGGWNEINVKHLNLIRESMDSFDIGVEFVDSGIAPYSARNYPGIESFVKSVFEDQLTRLSEWEINGNNLYGSWMVDISISAPLANKPVAGNKQPDSFTIQNLGPSPFPSPGNPTFTVLYAITTPGRLQGDIYDVRGRKVKNLANSYQTGPSGILQWDGRNAQGFTVASGNYYLRIKFNDQVEHRKIIVLR